MGSSFSCDNLHGIVSLLNGVSMDSFREAWTRSCLQPVAEKRTWGWVLRIMQITGWYVGWKLETFVKADFTGHSVRELGCSSRHGDLGRSHENISNWLCTYINSILWMVHSDVIKLTPGHLLPEATDSEHFPFLFFLWGLAYHKSHLAFHF